MESTVFLRKDIDSLNLIADLHTTPAQNTFLRIPHDGRRTPVLLLMAELLVIADVQMHTNILRYLLQIAFSILRTYKTFLRMSRKISSRIFLLAFSTFGDAVCTTIPSETGVLHAVGRSLCPSTSTTQIRQTALMLKSS